MPGDPSQEWDDIHFGHDEPKNDDPKNLPADDDIESRTFATDDGLESSASKLEDDDPIPGDPSKPKEEPKKEEETPVSSDMSGIELYLSQFDIEAGMIQFEDGTSAHFNDLEPAKQAEVLQQLHASQAKTVEDQFGLDENEIGLLNYLRSNNLSVEQMIDKMVQEKLSTVVSMQELAQEDYSKMEPDAIYIKFLKETTPDATPEQIATDLAKAKELSNFTKLTENLRTQYTAAQKATVEQKAQEAKAEHDRLVESQRQEIVNTVAPMTEIAGIALNNDIKNNVLDHILQTNEDGDSAFMDEVFADPQSLFKAAFWYVYGEAIVAQRDEFWKKEKSAAYKRGKEDALGVQPTEKPGRTFVAKGDKGRPHTESRPAASKQETTEDDWSSLHD